MSQSEKASYYRALKDAGVQFDKHYREYSTDELKAAHAKLVEAGAAQEVPVAPQPQPQVAPPVFTPAQGVPADGRFTEQPQPRAPQPPPQPQLQRPQPPQAPLRPRNENELPGQRLNTAPDEPIRVDEHGLVWYQEEVRKPAFPKPRGRRVLKYLESGTKTETVQNGEYIESFEVAGDEQTRSAEVKITLPSYQVGIYKDRRFPFKIHIYNENRGFDLFEVQNYYGGSELVPPEIKRVYVENVLCYDIRTTVRAIQTEYRQLQLQNRV